MLARKVLFSLLVLSLGLIPALAAAQGSLDAPTVTVLRSSRTSVTLQIQAGSTGAPDGFLVDWTRADQYVASGGWNGSADCSDFTGTPTLNVDGSASTYALGPNETIIVEIGDLFDETGLSATDQGELDSGTEFVFRSAARDEVGNASSAFTPDVFVTTESVGSTNCTYTQGYWKTHPLAWPVSSLTLGSVNYTQAQLLDIFNTPAAGNGLISLAHQLIAAKLNVAQGAVAPLSTQQAIADADALIGGLVIPPVGGGYLAPAATSALTEELDQFNNGYIGPGHCGTTPAETTTWGAIKRDLR